MIQQEDSTRKIVKLKINTNKIFSNFRLNTRNSLFLGTKAIGPVVAVALLLVIAVVAVVGFQSWFQTYSFGVFVNVETTSSGAITGTGIETIVGDFLYIKNGGSGNLSITKVEIDGFECSGLNGSYSTGMQELNVSSCVGNATTSIPEIVVFTSTEIISKKIFLKDFTGSTSGGSVESFDCSSLAGGEWIKVPAMAPYTTTEFCVMKYEAKQNGTNATSTATNLPWVSINQTDAKQACENLGTGYHLITNAEWMSITRNIEQVDNNWVNSTGGIESVGVGSLKQGNVGGTGIAGASYDGADPEASSDGVNSLGSLELDNEEVIWDLIGNVWEWNNDTTNKIWIDGVVTNGYWNTQTNTTFRLNAGPSNSSWGSSTGTGYVWDSTVQTNAFLRGGNLDNGVFAGAFALHLGLAPSFTSLGIGFRCSYAE